MINLVSWFICNGREEVGRLWESDVKLRPMLEVQHAHELRVAEVAVEFIRQGFEWTPPLTMEWGQARWQMVRHGWVMCVDVEVRLSQKSSVGQQSLTATERNKN